MKINNDVNWDLKDSYDVIYAASFFDELPNADIDSQSAMLKDVLNPNGHFCLYSQWQDFPFITHTEINRIWQSIHPDYGLKIYKEVKKSLEKTGLKTKAQIELEVGFYLSVWVKD